MDSDPAEHVSIKQIVILLGNIQGILPKSANFRYSVINNLSRYAGMNGIVVEQTTNPSISFSVDGESIELFEKIEAQFAFAIKRIKLVTATGPQYKISADYVVGSKSEFVNAYNKCFLYSKYAKDFDELMEAELEVKDE